MHLYNNLQHLANGSECKSLASNTIATKEADSSRVLPLNTKIKHSQLPCYIQDVLPDKYSYQFSSFEYLCEHNKAFHATMLINVHSEEMAKQWLKEHEHQTDVTYHITRGVPIKGQKVLCSH